MDNYSEEIDVSYPLLKENNFILSKKQLENVIKFIII
jgi:hypothetical protein